MHIVWPLIAEKDPASQFMQATADDTAEYWPATQSTQLDAPEFAWNVPRGQPQHSVPPTAPRNFPAAHLLQAISPVPENRPTPQSVHERAPADDEYLPAEQSAHADEDDAPRIAKAVPAEQVTH